MTRADRYRIRRKPGYRLRVDDLDADRVDGYWDFKRKEWFDVQSFTDPSRAMAADEEANRDAYIAMGAVDAAETTECWRCGRQRYTFESCHHCGGSCKPLTKAKQQADPSYKRLEEP